MFTFSELNWAAVVPMANEEPDFAVFQQALAHALDQLGSGHVYFVIDKVSKDRTLELCRELATRDSRFSVVWAPDNKTVVDAYLAGFRRAYDARHEFIIEMDAGMSHDPSALPMFLRALNEGNNCVFGSRYINGGSMTDSPFKRRLFSRGGSILANLLLGTKQRDMTSGFEAFHRDVVGRLLRCKLKSTGHFYQTEVRYLLRRERSIAVPIHYKSPSPRVRVASLVNSFAVLFYYAFRRITFHHDTI